jgi:hypothetical protein
LNSYPNWRRIRSFAGADSSHGLEAADDFDYPDALKRRQQEVQLVEAPEDILRTDVRRCGELVSDKTAR